jgi:hypothetical protein
VELSPVPVFMRIGDGDEYEIGTFAPDISLNGLREATVDIRKSLAALLREAADEAERIVSAD